MFLEVKLYAKKKKKSNSFFITFFICTLYVRKAAACWNKGELEPSANSASAMTHCSLRKSLCASTCNNDTI